MADQTPFRDIVEMVFKVYSEAEIEKISVMQVTSEEAINKLGHCNRGGLYDLRMGPMARISDELCETCNLSSQECMGHCGHIDMPLPVYNPTFVRELGKLLRMMCLGCGKLQCKPEQVLLMRCQLKLLAKGYCHEALHVAVLMSSFSSNADHEIKISEDGREVKVDQNIESELDILMKNLDQYYKKVISGDCRRDLVITSTVRAVKDECLSSFLDSISVSKRCKFCHLAMFKVNYKNSQFIISVKCQILQDKIINGDVTFDNPGILKLDLTKESVLMAHQVQKLLRHTWYTDQLALLQLFPVLQGDTSAHPVDMFFITKLLVIPNKYRPLVRIRDAVVEHESCVLLKNVLRLCRCMKFLSAIISDPTQQLNADMRLILNEIPGSSDHQKADKVWQMLQGSVDNLLDATSNMEVNQTQKGIKQIFEKKAGLFRSNLMGKRVNFSARSVLAPDPALAVDEVGVPLDFAKHLHYPVPVTPWNVAYLRKLVINGPFKYPGAQMIQDENGKMCHLQMFNLKQRTAFAKRLLTPPEDTSKMVRPQKIVHRQLLDGDLVLMNRQPTLHRPSIQAHRARVMKGVRVLRLPYANCKAYNADFDGDEMNLHFPQDEVSRSEAYHLITTHNQYLTPKDGSPLAGLVQDCVVAGVMLSVRGTLYGKEDYMQMVNVALQDHKATVKILSPALIKPREMWTGKQVISTVLHNVIPHKQALPTFKFKTSVKAEVWQTTPPRPARGGERWGTTPQNDMSESEFVMREGELVCGVLDKSAIGSTSYGLIHVCYDLYGGAVATHLLTAFNRLFMYYLQLHGHTISSKEFLTSHKVADNRRKRLTELVETAPTKVLKKLDMDKSQFCNFWETNHVRCCDKNLALIDAAYTQVLGKATSEITTENEAGLFRRTLDNKMRLMVDSGAKGSKVNMNQMASLFGPTAMDGKRMPLSLAGKTLPSFMSYDMNPRAGGYIRTRFMTGMDPQSYFFLCIVGRDSLQHTAVKTANSGYMQRCLIKHLEGIQVMYDMTVRNSDGLVLQFKYGEDGLDVMKVPFLQSPQTLDVVVDNYSRLLDPKVVDVVKERASKLSISKQKKKINKWLGKYENRSKGERCSGFTLFCREQPALGSSTDTNEDVGRSVNTVCLQMNWLKLKPEQRLEYHARALQHRPPQPSPVLATLRGHDQLGAVSEVLDKLISTYYSKSYLARDAHHRTYTKKEIETTISMKILRSHVDPGEAVGAICAQALGEPLTQMTLNTFHFAGRDELNVTLGVPRMVEILRTASGKISTPIMEVPFLPTATRAQAEVLKKKFTEVSLKQVLHMMEAKCVEVTPRHPGSLTFDQLATLRFTLLPTSHYSSELPVTCRDVLQFMEKYYFKGLIRRFSLAKTRKVPEICATREKEHNKAHEDKEDHNENDADDAEDLDHEDTNDDADQADKARQNKMDEQDYDDDEGEEEEDEGFGDEDEDNKENGAEDADYHDVVITDTVIKSKSKSTRKSSLSPEEISRRVYNVVSSNSLIETYVFDTVNEQWCELTLRIANDGRKYDFKSAVSDTASQAYVHRIPGIKRAFVEEKEGRLTLRTEGVNVYKLVEWANLLDIDRLYTNDIQLVARTYGIEAAQRSIIREIRAVQDAYNITIDYRHLTLLADYFTCSGLYKACSRSGLRSCQSTMQQMSYESTLYFLKSAITQGVTDRMQSPSARIATGQLVRAGTNVMDILVDLDKTLNINNKK